MAIVVSRLELRNQGHHNQPQDSATSDERTWIKMHLYA